MKQIYHILAVVLFVTGALLTSCNKVESIQENNPEITSEAQTIQFTATLAAKVEDPQSKAITPGTDGEDKEILNVAWAAGEEIALYYQKDDDSYATTTATVGTPNGDGSAPITATLSSPKDGGTVKFVYPASLHNGTGDIDESILLSQHGNLTGANGISTLYDAATGSSTISTAAGTAVVSSKVTMTNRVCICKFHFDIVDGAYGPARNFSPIIIRDDNGHTYTITSDRDDGMGGSRGFNRDDDVYIALLPVSGKTVTFYTKYSNHYLFTASGTTLTAGKFYRNLSINMAKDDSGLCDKYKDLRDGSITASDGENIQLIDQMNVGGYDLEAFIDKKVTVTGVFTWNMMRWAIFPTSVAESQDTGLTDLTEDTAASSDVYTITGINLGQVEINSLPAGFYIVNGKKVIKR